MSDDVDEPSHPEDTDDGLSEALIEGNQELVAAILRKRSSLSKAEIEIIADLLNVDQVGDESEKANKKIYRKRLRFKAWTRGRPVSDPYEERVKSFGRGRRLQAEIDKGTKQIAVIQMEHERSKKEAEQHPARTVTSVAQLKKDLRRYRRVNRKPGSKKP